MTNLKAVPKPEPPSVEALSSEDRARRALAALGVKDDALAIVFNGVDEEVHKALGDLWRELQRQPTHAEIMERIGGVTKPYEIRDAMARLRRSGRVIQPKPRVNVPV